jgi:hypothetical protein
MESQADRVSVSIDRLLSNDDQAVVVLKEELKKTGWCLIDLPLNLVEEVREFKACVESFFSLSDDEKREYKYAKCFGYRKLPFKETFRWLMGNNLNLSEVPGNLAGISGLADWFDSFFTSFVSNISLKYFGFKNMEHP